MPAEPRRSSRKTSNDDEIELKRARGEISCAECRRLKLKCDKKTPCGSCVRRGCTSICPNGSLSAGQGTRFILADTEQLHRKISEMSERIRQLEDALAIFQAGISHERHPLLRDELLSVKFGPEVRRTVDDENHRDAISTSIDALGTLTLGEHGESKYFGRSAGSETMLSTTNVDEEGEAPPILEPQLANLAITFPLTIIEDGSDELIERLEAHLPPQTRAWALCETYFEHLTWWSRPIKRDELIDDVLVPIYNCRKDPTKNSYHRDGSDDEGKCPITLATLFFVFALGSLVDLTLPPCSAEAELYYRLGRAALSLRSIFDSPEIETVQALLLMGQYHSICSSRYSMESAWRIISFAAKIAQSVGLHRDSAQWKLDNKRVQRRRNLFWELFTAEVIHCMSLGRPPALAHHHIDCEIPDDDEPAKSDDDGSSLHGFWRFKHNFAKTVWSGMIDGMLAAKAPSYAQILEFDRQIRQTTLPNVRLYLRPDEENYNNPSIVLKSFFLSHFRSITMIHIHRTFFAQALLDHPTNPLASPYAPSFLAANRCASILLRSFLHHWTRSPELCCRFWGMWTHTFSAAVILGSTVTRSPNATMAPSALADLDIAVEFFERGAQMNVRARQALPILRNLRERAMRAFSEYRNRHLTPSSLDIKLRIGPEDEFQDELAMFGGQTRVVTNKFLSRKRGRVPTKPRGENIVPYSPTPSASTATSTTAASPGPTPQTVSTPSDDGVPLPQTVEEQMSNVHPSLMEYLSLFPADASISFMDVDPTAASASAPGAQPQGSPPPFPTSAPFATMPSQTPAGAMPAHQPPHLPHQQLHTSAPPPQPLSGDALQFLNVLPAANAGGPIGDPHMFFANNTFPADIFDGSFAPGELGEQWHSLMRETGFFDAQGTLRQDGFAQQQQGVGAGTGAGPGAFPQF
ncbi:fungal-specific transcription factor domain-containing protein [Daedaleopsis nitida]|nr:fungal-specific transcription factor domain-containing protein [Daedaleopsis nitida]